jgi:hypothetical protein
MDEPHGGKLFLVFIAGYLGVYYALLWTGVTLFSHDLEASWVLLGPQAIKAKASLVSAPVVGAFFGSWTASVLVMSYTARGSHKLGASRFFGIGWFSVLVCNMLTISMALRLFVDEMPGRAWIEFLGRTRFNGWLFLLTPSLGYAGGVAAVILTGHIIEAQRG